MLLTLRAEPGELGDAGNATAIEEKRQFWYRFSQGLTLCHPAPGLLGQVQLLAKDTSSTNLCHQWVPHLLALLMA